MILFSILHTSDSMSPVFLLLPVSLERRFRSYFLPNLLRAPHEPVDENQSDLDTMLHYSVFSSASPYDDFEVAKAEDLVIVEGDDSLFAQNLTM